MLLSEYIHLGTKLDQYGVFDPVLDKDSHFFINIQRLKRTKVPEFVGSCDSIHEFFKKIIKLLDRAGQKNERDIFFKQARKLFEFPEVNGICLGYAEGTTGVGFNGVLAGQVMNTAYDIVKAGVEDPEFFELLPLFQENVGADRLSDMIATLILGNIEDYTRRINKKFGITKILHDELKFNGDFLINPYKNQPVLLVPTDILHALPVAASWEDIDIVVFQNDTIRAEMNYEVISEWKKYSAHERKSYLLRQVFCNAETCKRVIEEYRNEVLEAYDMKNDFGYYLVKLWQEIESIGFDWKTTHKGIDSFVASKEIIGFFKQWIENNKGWEVVQNADTRHREKIVQRVIHGQALAYIQANDLDISCEPDEGRGPVDFKISKGGDKTIFEVKLSSNPQYLHGFEVQIQEYAKAEQTDKFIYVLLDLGNPIKIQKVKELHDKTYNAGKRTPSLIVIDTTKKRSASNA